MVIITYKDGSKIKDNFLEEPMDPENIVKLDCSDNIFTNLSFLKNCINLEELCSLKHIDLSFLTKLNYSCHFKMSFRNKVYTHHEKLGPEMDLL